LLAATPAHADDYPSRPVHIMVGFIPGAAADITARVLGNGLGKLLGQQFVVENKPGAGSNLAAEFSARAPKDGYTLFLGSSANIANQVITPNLGFDMTKDFAPIALATMAPVILVVHPSTGVKSLGELIALAKAKPGEILYASTGVGTAPHLAAEMFDTRAGVKMVHIPYQGSPQAVTDLIAGRTAVMFSPASAVIAQVEAGKLIALASAAAKRPSIAPDLPTMAEAGMPDFDTSIWFGLMAPAGTPPEIVDKLARAVPEAIKSSEAQTALKSQGFDPLPGGPEEFTRFMVAETAKWNEAAKAAGLKK
jgi:tripartite-type tricarboxylate transporter receptor subunit TctC